MKNTIRPDHFNLLFLIVFLITSAVNSSAQTKNPVKIFYQGENRLIDFGIEKLKKSVQVIRVEQETDATLIIATTKELCAELNLSDIYSSIKPEGFSIKKIAANKLVLAASDQNGAMYGIMDIATQLQMSKTLNDLEEKTISPALGFRGIKFNLPWDSYRTDTSLQIHSETIRDLKYWEAFLNMMAENRFNALTLWNLHPFSFMIRAKNFPDACPYNDTELKQWQDFWTGLFRMAADRGIKTYIFNWNIMVSDAFAKKYGVADYCLDTYEGKKFIGEGDYSPIIQQYTRESLAQVLEEYPDLTGIGASQNERMEGVDEQVWQDWIVNTYFDVIHNANRKVDFIIRAHTHPAPALTRKAVEDNADRLGTVLMDVKFNWSHAHATPDLVYIHGGSKSKELWQPAPKNYKMVYTMRNEDFFVLRWGEPDFIRDVIKRNSQDYVGGYLVGSETYIPGIEYITKPGNHLTWKYAFEKQWLFYETWGKLMYDSSTKDEVFANSFNQKYAIGFGDKLVEAHKLADKMPLKLASFYSSSWDFTLYSEGFLGNAPAGKMNLYDCVSPFISVNEIIKTTTLDTNLVSISDFVSGNYHGAHKISPLQLADGLEKNSKKALTILQEISTENPTLIHEIDDIRTWAYLGLYFSEKLKGGTSLQQYRVTGNTEKQKESIAYLEKALSYWETVVEITCKYIDEISLTHLNNRYVTNCNERPLVKFSWGNLTGEVKNDIDIAKRGN